MQGGRPKAYRPIEPEARRAAFEAGLSAYDEGRFFEAHELLEPAWMGTDDQAERALYQGLIKLAAGYVHCLRGNPIGMARNLEGARDRLAASAQMNPSCGRALGVDLAGLLTEIDVRLASVRTVSAEATTNPSAVAGLSGAAPCIRCQPAPPLP